MDEDHHKLHEMMDRIWETVKMCKNMTDGKEGESKEQQISNVNEVMMEKLTILKDLFPAFTIMALEHLRNEESTITVAARKYLPIEYQIKFAQDVFDITPIESWESVMPFMLTNLPLPVWKVRYLKTFVWAYPYRAQEIGRMLYLGCDRVTWFFVSSEMPELIFRGLPGFKRIY